MKTEMLGYSIFNGSKEELLNIIDKYEKVNIISGNPEVLYNGLNNEELFKNFTDKDSIIIPDGVGVVLASKIIKSPVKEKIAGIELMDSILKNCNKNGKAVYLLGTTEDVLKECERKLLIKYRNLNIIGKHNGFFDMDNCKDILEDIKESKPYALFIAMGCPRQEKFISKYMDKLPCKIYMGVGGSFDVFAGKVKRAPRWMIDCNLEWLYRVVKEPYRIKRLASIPKFLLKVALNKQNS
ncbi:glycosyltransferase [Clostridium sporogenes]|jgi:N-acetylglucosaminyldiphosphoundecaprenol N-acetyl-beta-D-mannosaminyltransferase|uniref:N-acetylglucosaminyldiphosphoundecaprenol N-acetyl-beta-D-mannosaminyltransferase n=2 Tax=Clostridium TaxID=1485 RepID=A0AAE4YZG8_CLOSG|nr:MULTISPECIES: WecB/TagA/CpsF family glycosyltransferase [Clostridium]EKS4343272.1 WecB/TagA/CpsF family glycosyltransferase [Clostridium botulinum]MBE6078782.1 WecB/TagA/CpsF family glycosyltransferase [Clostridium lundense]EDU35689.1 glycosyltransferase, WecB/TagA/CpsF family [Clostridium sporogenes ATCC 15579]EKS4396160.1 WecB/TagA/CpsF family glycosyltransferase [Clostridium botulinum]KIS24925.1 UDP-N-acetyl-D-mannosaminuronic acid transferase [Clostridium botulinum B2 450]